MVVVVAVLVGPTVGAVPAEEPPEAEPCRLEPRIEILEDPAHLLGLDDVLTGPSSRRFRPADRTPLDLGLSRSAFWLRVTVPPVPDDVDCHTDTWCLAINRPPVFNVAVFSPSPEGGDLATRVQVTGAPGLELGPTTRRHRMVYPLALEGDGDTTLLLRLDSPYTSLFLPLAILPERQLLEHSLRRTYWTGAYGGLCLAMAALNLALWAFLRDRSHLLYVLHVVSWLVYFTELNGFIGERFLPLLLRPELVASASHRLSILSLGLGVLFAALFTRSFLFTSHGPRWCELVLRAIVVLAGALAVAAPIADNMALNSAASALGMASPMVLIAAGIVSWRSGFSPARFFLLAWFCLVAGGFIFALGFNGVLPLTEPVYHGFQLGSGLEQLLLSLALADRFRVLTEQRRRAELSESIFRQQAVTDALTGLYNWRLLSSRLPTEVHRAETGHRPLALAVLDVDDFKDFNDTWGHAAGDEVLRRLGAATTRSIRDTDLAFRHGGEEFVVLLPDTDATAAVAVVERVRAEFTAACADAVEGRELKVTLSAGIASLHPDEDHRSLFERADRALYRAKTAGKDRVVVEG